MVGRRTAGMLVAAFMLHLNFVEADAACASHGRETAATHPATAAHHHASPTQSDQGAGQKAPCDTPSQADCCQALASCTMLLGVNGEGQSFAGVPGQDHVRSSTIDSPVSLLVPPDTPPPKA